MCWGHVRTMKHATLWNIYWCVMRAWSRSSFVSFLKLALCCGSCVDPCWTVSELQYNSTQLKTIASYVMHLSLDDLLKCKIIPVELKVKVHYSHRGKNKIWVTALQKYLILDCNKSLFYFILFLPIYEIAVQLLQEFQIFIHITMYLNAASSALHLSQSLGWNQSSWGLK